MGRGALPNMFYVDLPLQDAGKSLIGQYYVNPINLFSKHVSDYFNFIAKDEDFPGFPCFLLKNNLGIINSIYVTITRRSLL